MARERRSSRGPRSGTSRPARLQHAGPTDLALEGAFLHLIEIELLARDGGCARLELRYAQGDTGEEAETAGHQN